jgi:hypothetical protein
VGLALSPQDALWGVRRGWLSWRDIPELTTAWLESAASPLSELIELATLSKQTADEAGRLLEAVVGASGERESELSEKKWLYLALRAIWVERLEPEQALFAVSEIACEFDDFPELNEIDPQWPSLEPTWDPGKHSVAENRRHLIEKWRLLLKRMGEQLGVQWNPD